MAHYGSVAGGDTFFNSRLHAYDWTKSTPADKQKALVEATEYIEQFNYLGQKAAVQTVLTNNPDATCEDLEPLLEAAELSQPLEFPRGTDTVVPAEIEQATYLIAKELLSGRDPNADLENLSVKQAKYGGVATSYQRDGNNQEHLAHLISSPHAFNLIRPFFRERDLFEVKRV